MKASTFLKLLTLLLLTSCYAPAPIAKLWPKTVGKKEFWNMGQQFVCDENNKISYECAFKKTEYNKLVFNVKITNNSDSTILVAPERFFQVVYLNDTSRMASNFADNPETVLLNLELENSRSVAQQKNAMATAIVSTVVATGAAVAVASSKKDDETKAETIGAIGDANSVLVNSAVISSETANERVAENYNAYGRLSESYLRKTTLPPGFYIDGEVRFPYYENAKWYCIQLNAEKSEVDFYFSQILFFPAEYNVNR